MLEGEGTMQQLARQGTMRQGTLTGELTSAKNTRVLQEHAPPGIAVGDEGQVSSFDLSDHEDEIDPQYKLVIRSNGRMQRTPSQKILLQSKRREETKKVKSAHKRDSDGADEFLGASDPIIRVSSSLSEDNNPTEEDLALNPLYKHPNIRTAEERGKAIELLQDLKFFQRLTDAQRLEVVSHAALSCFAVGELLFRVGEEQDKVFIAVSGRYRSYTYDEEDIRTLNARPRPRTNDASPLLSRQADSTQWKSGRQQSLASSLSRPNTLTAVSSSASQADAAMASLLSLSHASLKPPPGAAKTDEASYQNTGSGNEIRGSGSGNSTMSGASLLSVRSMAQRHPPDGALFKSARTEAVGGQRRRHHHHSNMRAQAASGGNPHHHEQGHGGGGGGRTTGGEATPPPRIDTSQQRSPVKPHDGAPLRRAAIDDVIEKSRCLKQLGTINNWRYSAITKATTELISTPRTAPRIKLLSEPAHAESPPPQYASMRSWRSLQSPRKCAEYHPKPQPDKLDVVHEDGGSAVGAGSQRSPARGKTAVPREKKVMSERMALRQSKRNRKSKFARTAKRMLKPGQSMRGLVHVLRTDGEGQEREVWLREVLELDPGGILSLTAGTAHAVRVGNVRECERIEAIRKLGEMRHVVRVQWRGRGATCFSVGGREESLDWAEAIARLRVGDDESIVSHIARLVHDTSFSAGDVFGNEGLRVASLQACFARRETTVVCAEGGYVLTLKLSEYLRVVRGENAWPLGAIMSSLRVCEELSLLRAVDLLLIADMCEPLEVADTQVLATQGAPADYVYFVVSGALSVCDEGRTVAAESKDQDAYTILPRAKSSKSKGGWEEEVKEEGERVHVRVGTLGAGDLFGHEAGVGSGPYPMSLVAESAATVLRMSADGLRNIFSEHARARQAQEAQRPGEEGARQESAVRIGAAQGQGGSALNRKKLLCMAKAQAGKMLHDMVSESDVPAPRFRAMLRYYPGLENFESVKDESDSEGSEGGGGGGSDEESFDQNLTRGSINDGSAVASPKGVSPKEYASKLGFSRDSAVGVGDGGKFALKIKGGVDPKTDRRAKLDLIRRQFRVPVQATGFALRGYFTPRPMTQRDYQLPRPSLDLPQLSARERVRASWEDEEEQNLFSLSEVERDLIRDMRSVIRWTAPGAKSLSQRVKDAVVQEQGTDCSRILRVDGDWRPPEVAEDMLRCTVSDLDLVLEDIIMYNNRDSNAASAFLVFENSHACMTALNSKSLRKMRAFPSSAEELALFHVRYNKTPPSTSNDQPAPSTAPHPHTPGRSTGTMQSFTHAFATPPHTPWITKRLNTAKLLHQQGALSPRLRTTSPRARAVRGRPAGAKMAFAELGIGRPITAPVKNLNIKHHGQSSGMHLYMDARQRPEKPT